MTSKFIVRIVILAFCLFVGPQTFGQESITPQKKALIKELLSLMNATNNAEAIASQFQQQLRAPMIQMFSHGLKQLIASENLTPADLKRAEAGIGDAAQRALNRFQLEMAKRINYDVLLEQVWLEIYSRHFTDDELKELIALHKSPVAQKLIKLLPQMAGELFPKLQELVSPTITQAISEIIEEEKKKLLPKRN